MIDPLKPKGINPPKKTIKQETKRTDIETTGISFIPIYFKPNIKAQNLRDRYNIELENEIKQLAFPEVKNIQVPLSEADEFTRRALKQLREQGGAVEPSDHTDKPTNAKDPLPPDQITVEDFLYQIDVIEAAYPPTEALVEEFHPNPLSSPLGLEWIGQDPDRSIVKNQRGDVIEVTGRPTYKGNSAADFFSEHFYQFPKEDKIEIIKNMLDIKTSEEAKNYRRIGQSIEEMAETIDKVPAIFIWPYLIENGFDIDAFVNNLEEVNCNLLVQLAKDLIFQAKHIENYTDIPELQTYFEMISKIHAKFPKIKDCVEKQLCSIPNLVSKKIIYEEDEKIKSGNAALITEKYTINLKLIKHGQNYFEVSYDRKSALENFQKYLPAKADLKISNNQLSGSVKISDLNGDWYFYFREQTLRLRRDNKGELRIRRRVKPKIVIDDSIKSILQRMNITLNQKNTSIQLPPGWNKPCNTNPKTKLGSANMKQLNKAKEIGLKPKNPEEECDFTQPQTPELKFNWLLFLFMELIAHTFAQYDLSTILFWSIGMLETIYNSLVGTLRSFKIWGWRPFGWMRYTSMYEGMIHWVLKNKFKALGGLIRKTSKNWRTWHWGGPVDFAYKNLPNNGEYNNNIKINIGEIEKANDEQKFGYICAALVLGEKWVKNRADGKFDIDKLIKEWNKHVMGMDVQQCSMFDNQHQTDPSDPDSLRKTIQEGGGIA